MNKEQLYELSFHLIAHSGNARSLAMEAIQASKKGNFELAVEKLKEADKEFVNAHRFQTELIQKEAGGEKYDLPIILVHAQDHLMTAMTVKDLAIEIVEIYQRTKKV
ncbi:PTS lactose/cellobiose transporter subunit IIA [Metabacillus dongyingensis]|jgi:PTS system cellobiose-specific IIA component|uniref:PTS lactose/cellobiose transporter subunit IIA n=1 Tax=Metabacillus dongyingensis TaxID=2874282 RepID=UPI001CBE5822|nr:PTS lactose/cellobiose transporter subunit IIA [Metabacillus dongyingensis]UAL51551.1 PTS lactose/cellobiose transporter subunit IIA [Metabacillus dongyingensis]UOK57448.1 PTS lactose/cellobiose transporter subunit IIA [Bacillus sp. OVS6]USK27856.1 PTS lactose/cellobiose transporter subunit IIA [Bacillus sp. CMF21]